MFQCKAIRHGLPVASQSPGPGFALSSPKGGRRDGRLLGEEAGEPSPCLPGCRDRTDLSVPATRAVTCGGALRCIGHLVDALCQVVTEEVNGDGLNAPLTSSFNMARCSGVSCFFVVISFSLNGSKRIRTGWAENPTGQPPGTTCYLVPSLPKHFQPRAECTPSH